MASEFTLQLCGHRVNLTEGPRPAARSAHNCVLGPQDAVYLLAGDSGNAGHRFNDVWRLSGSSGSSGSSDGSCQWQQLSAGQQPQQGSSSCTARSNAAAAATQDWLFLFGGWDSSGLQPLAQLEAFSFNTRTWHTPTPRGSSPSPRGQSAAAANTSGTAVYFFGGWDGSRRFNDLHVLLLRQPGDLNDPSLDQQQTTGWVWQQVTPQPAPPKGARSGITFQQQQASLQQQQKKQQQHQAATNLSATSDHPQQHQHQHQHQQQHQHQHQHGELQVPCERADHSIVSWHYCDDGNWKDLLVVFGGSSSGGLLNDVWLFDVSTCSWTQAYHGGAAPCPRSSCAAAITGDVMLLHGGQTPTGVLHDMHLLNLSTLTFIQIDLGPILQPLCRHSMVVSDSSCLVFGGYDGSTASNQLIRIGLQPVQQLQRSSLQDLINSMACCGSTCRGSVGSNLTSKAQSGLSAAEAVSAAVGGSADGDGDPGDAGSGGSRLKAVGVVLPPALPVPPAVKALSKKAGPPPLKLSDLPNAEEVAAMPQWKQVRQLHQAALAAGCDQYVDPKTGYTVFTAKYLQQRQCCGNKCRHCPHGWANVAKQRFQQLAPATLDW